MSMKTYKCFLEPLRIARLRNAPITCIVSLNVEGEVSGCFKIHPNGKITKLQGKTPKNPTPPEGT